MYQHGAHKTDFLGNFKFWELLQKKNLKRSSKFGSNLTTISDTLREDLSKYGLLRAIRNILDLDSSAQGSYSWVSVAKLRRFYIVHSYL
jgi:hypothetical protein